MTNDPALFSATDTYSGDPLRPDLETITPVEIIAALTAPQRIERVKWLIKQAHDIVDMAWEKHGQGRVLAASCVLFSGGNDSTVLAHLMRGRADYAVHCNTTIGIEQTRQFVRDTCILWGLDLLERKPPKSYRELVLEIMKDGKPRGFPGPAMHFLMFTRLKERCLEQIRRELVENPRRERVMYFAGRRRSESKRRANIPLFERRGSVVWASPIAMWTKLDMVTYRLMFRDTDDPVPLNEISQILHMSAECLCGAFAKENELDEIRFWFPDEPAVLEIEAIEAELALLGLTGPRAKWGHRQGKPTEKTGMLCTSCEFTFAPDEGALF